jgi:hypothetical protein
MKIKGTHLWKVSLKQWTEALWITTNKYDISLAVQKATTFLKNHAAYRGLEILSVENKGTLDA